MSTDFSKNADHAIEYALTLFENAAVNYTLLNSCSILHNIPETLISLEDILREQSEKRLTSTLNGIRKTHNKINIESLSVFGDPATTIKKVAKDQRMDLVVLGSRGSSFGDALYGSTTTKLIRRIDRPMLVVPGEYKCRTPKRIILATDLIQIDDLNVLDAMMAIARKFDAEVVIVNVTGSEEHQKVKQALTRLNFNNHFNGIRSRFEVVDNKDIVAGIREYVHRQQADLLVLFPKRYPRFINMFHRSITRNFVKHSDIPVLVV